MDLRRALLVSRHSPDGSQFILFDATKGTKQPAFDHAKLAAALGQATGATFDPQKLPFQTIELSPDANTVSVSLRGKKFNCDMQAVKCTPDVSGAANARRPAITRKRYSLS